MQQAKVGDSLGEGERILTICNACRYCEGYCAVFPAMERRVSFGTADLSYLANLCHNCGECFYACPYAPPHEFAVNVPKTLAEIRVASYHHYAWPRPLGEWLAPAAFVAGLAGWLWIESGREVKGVGANFYAAISHGTMVGIFGTVSACVLALFIAGFLRFWRESGEGLRALLTLASLGRTMSDVLALKYLGGARAWFHHLTFYGFALCLASTTVAAIYHYFLGWEAPYGYLSWPVVLGTLGGIGLLVGPLGLLCLKQRQDAAITADQQNRMDVAFLTLLFLTSATGLALLAFRTASAMPPLLAVHLAVVLSLFIALPYGKFVHGIYRAGALLRYALEQSREEKSA